MNNILHHISIKSSKDEIFRAITSTEGLNSWWTLKSQGEAKLGSSYQFYFNDDYDWQAEIVEIEAPNKIVWRMTKADEDWTGTTLSFLLDERKDHVVLEFEHLGWPNLNEHFRRSNTCWAILFDGLRKYVETGSVIPFEERA